MAPIARTPWYPRGPVGFDLSAKRLYIPPQTVVVKDMTDQALQFALKMRSAVAGLRSRLLVSYLDNIIYRHEIRMDPMGRLRKGSPVIAAHALMVLMLGLTAALFVLTSWSGVFYFTGGAIAALAVGTYPLAYRRAFQSLARERASGSLEQLYLTRLTPRQFFEGKFFGLLAPFLEVRRYLMTLSIIFCLSTAFQFPGAAWLGGAVLCLTAINQIGYSACLGTLAGLRSGCRSSKMSYSLWGDWDLNPWPHHLGIILKCCFYLFPALAVLLWAGITSRVAPLMYISYGLMLLIPFVSAYHLRDLERAQRDRLAGSIKKLLSFEPVP